MTEKLDRILLSEDHLTPSPGFLASVMEAVRQYGRYEMPIPFPWKRFTIGLVGGLCCTVLSMILLAPELFPIGPTGTGTRLLLPPWLWAPEIVWTTVGAVGTWLAVRLSVALGSD